VRWTGGESSCAKGELSPDSTDCEFTEEEFKRKSKLVLKMIYFFQVLPFYVLQFCTGLSIGYPSILVPQLIASNRTDIVIDNASKGWIVSLDYGMTALIAIISGQLQSMYGPKKTSLLACVPICASWLIMAVAPNMSTILASRLLVGLGNGILTSSVYIVEVVSPDNRGSVVMMETAFRSLGMICVYLMGAFMDWQSIAWMVVPLPLLALVYGIFLPESPIYLSQIKGYTQLDEEDPPHTLTWAETKQSLLTTVQMFRRREVLIPLSLLMLVLVAQQCSAMKVIQGYAVQIFADVFTPGRSRGVKEGEAVDKDAYWSAVIMGSVRLLSTLLVAKYIRNFGRKTMYFLSAIATIVFEVAFGVVDYLDLGASMKELPIVIISCQVFALQIGVQTFPNLLSGELFPNDIRARCKGMIRAVSALLSFLMLKLFPYMEYQLGLYGSFWSLAACLALMLPVIFIFVPEPKDVSLDLVGEFFQPVSTKFYAKFQNNGDLVIPTPEESSSRIHMIENCFGTAGKPILASHKILLAEGMLTKRCNARAKRRHFFLFNDCLMWGTVLRENLNYIRQRTLRLEDIAVEDVRNTDAWRIHSKEKDFVLEAGSEAEKLHWMVLLHYAREDRVKYEHLTEDTEGSRTVSSKDPVLEYARKATETSNLAVNRLYQLYDADTKFHKQQEK